MALRNSLAPQTHLYMGDVQGRPLDAGKVYFGEPNKDPELYPINVYYDEALTIAAPQPIRTMGGFMNANGQMVEVYAAELTYSVKVLDGYGRQVFYQEIMSSVSTSSSVSTRLPYPNAVERTQSDKNSDIISVRDYGIYGNGTLADSQRLQAAINMTTGKELFFPAGNYALDATTVAVSNLSLVGEKGTIITPIATSNLEGRGKKLFHVTGNNVSFRGLRFDLGNNGNVIGRGTTYNYPEHAIYAERVKGITVQDCEVNDGVFGFVSQDCTDVVVTNNRFNRLERWGIFLEGADGFTVSGNTCDGGAYDGIKLSASQTSSKLSTLKNGYVFANTLTNNLRDGIDFAVDGTESVHIFSNIIKGNKIYGIEVKKSESNVNTLDMKDIHIYSNEIHLPTEAFYAILFRLEGTAGGTYKNCSAYDNKIYGVAASTTNYGIWAGGTNSVNIYDNQIYSVDIGILVGNSKNTIVKDNIINARKPVVIQGTGTDDNLITNNIIIASDGHGVSVLTGARNRVLDNKITTFAGYYSVEDETTGTGNSGATATAVIGNLTGSTPTVPSGKGRVGDIVRNSRPTMNTVAEWVAVDNSLTSATWVGTRFVGAITDLNFITLKSATSDLRIEPNAITYNRATSYLDQKIVGGQVAHRVAQVGGALEATMTVKFNCLQLNKVPTSASGLVAGDVWRDGNTLKIV